MLEEKVLNTINKYELIKKGNTIVIGVSGGPDSMALLNALINLNNKNALECKLIVAHVNHGIRKEADSETDFVINFCKIHNIPCFVKKENVIELAKKQNIGTEEAGRKSELRESFDFAAARAVANLSVLSEYCLPFVKTGGSFIAMKSFDSEDEISQAQTATELLGGKIENNFVFDLVENTPRRIIEIKKISQTPTGYPRNAKKIANSPIK